MYAHNFIVIIMVIYIYMMLSVGKIKSIVFLYRVKKVYIIIMTNP